MNLTTHLAEKYGMTAERAAEMTAQMAGTAAAEDMEFHLDAARRATSVAGRAFRASFTDGELISDHPTLVRVGADTAHIV